MPLGAHLDQVAYLLTLFATFQASVAHSKAKSWVHFDDLSSMVAALVSWVVQKSYSSTFEFASVGCSEQAFCICGPIVAMGQGEMCHPVLLVGAKICDEAFYVLRGGGVGFPSLRGDQFMGALVGGFATGPHILFAALQFLNGVASVLAATGSRSEQSAIEFV